MESTPKELTHGSNTHKDVKGKVRDRVRKQVLSKVGHERRAANQQCLLLL